MEEVLIVLEAEVTIDVVMAKMITQLYYKIGKTHTVWVIKYDSYCISMGFSYRKLLEINLF